jgi:iron complex transport system substrate-binding protein
VAEALDARDQGDHLIGRLQERVRGIESWAKRQPERPTMACIEWLDPLMAAGNWVPELVELAGGRCLFGEPGKHAPWMTWEQLVAADPDVIALMPCGFDIARTQREVPLLTERPEWSELKAVRRGRVYLTDGNQFFNRPGPRLVESLEILVELLHPVASQTRHEGAGWIRTA